MYLCKILKCICWDIENLHKISWILHKMSSIFLELDKKNVSIPTNHSGAVTAPYFLIKEVDNIYSFGFLLRGTKTLSSNTLKMHSGKFSRLLQIPCVHTCLHVICFAINRRYADVYHNITWCHLQEAMTERAEKRNGNGIKRNHQSKWCWQFTEMCETTT